MYKRSDEKMKIIYLRKESILIEEEKKRLFSTKIVEKEIFLDDIIEVTREEFKGNLNSMTIFLKNNQEEFLINEQSSNLEELYQFLIKQRENGRQIKISKIDIETLETTEV